MTTILRRTDSPSDLRRKLDEAVARGRTIALKRYCGKVSFEKDALEIQKQMRAEWDERAR